VRARAWPSRLAAAGSAPAAAADGAAGWAFAAPYERDGVTVIAAAVVTCLVGGGGGRDEQGGQGGGAGLVLSARPVGAYVVRDGVVRWRPALDVNRLVLAVAALGLVRAARRRPHRPARWQVGCSGCGSPAVRSRTC
jgi:hypothetical protein